MASTTAQHDFIYQITSVQSRQYFRILSFTLVSFFMVNGWYRDWDLSLLFTNLLIIRINQSDSLWNSVNTLKIFISIVISILEKRGQRKAERGASRAKRRLITKNENRNNNMKHSWVILCSYSMFLGQTSCHFRACFHQGVKLVGKALWGEMMDWYNLQWTSIPFSNSCSIQLLAQFILFISICYFNMFNLSQF